MAIAGVVLCSVVLPLLFFVSALLPVSPTVLAMPKVKSSRGRATRGTAVPRTRARRSRVPVTTSGDGSVAPSVPVTTSGVGSVAPTATGGSSAQLGVIPAVSRSVASTSLHLEQLLEAVLARVRQEMGPLVPSTSAELNSGMACSAHRGVKMCDCY